MTMKYAGFWRRALAILIDTILFVIIFFILKALITDNFFYVSLLYQLGCAVYYIGLTASPMQSTLGQKLLNIKIGTLAGERLSVMKAFFRYIMWMLPAWPAIIYSTLPSTSVIAIKLASFDIATDEAGAALDFMNSPEVQSYMLINGILAMIAAVGGIIWSIAIAIHQEKAGIHDRVCKQRAYIEI